jgi:DNA-binding LacI/PurR family transcriptional regulator
MIAKRDKKKIQRDPTRRGAAGSQIKQYIRSHGLAPGESLPTVRQMADHFAITRDAVWRALRRLQEEGWVEVLPNKRYITSRNLQAKILRSTRVRALFSGKEYIFFSGFRRLAEALTRQCHSHGIELTIDLLPLKANPDEHIWKDCDVLMIDSDSSGRVLEAFAEFPVPTIGLDAIYSDKYHANIVTDHHLGGRMAAEAILHRRPRHTTIVYYKGSDSNPRVAARMDGFRQAWLESGRSLSSLELAQIPWSTSTFEVGLNVQSFFQKKRAHGTYFVTDGRLAANFLDILAYQQIPVPQKVAVIGYDGAQRGELTDPPLTTIQQDMERIAQSAVDWIQRICENGEKAGVVERVPPLLVARKSF